MSNSKIPVQNVYYMLAYAFRILNERGFKSVATEKFDNVADLCAAILVKGMSVQIKRGLGREYILREESLSAPRGKINITESVKTLSTQRKQLICSYDVFSVDSYMNRIIKSTMLLLLQSDISKSRKKEIRKLLIFLSEVGTLDVHTINWQIQYNRNNQAYRMLISICNLLVKGLLQSSSSGKTKLMDFLDDQEEWRLYQAFVFEYFRKEFPWLKVSAPKIEWVLDDDNDDMLPEMETDITLSYKNTWLIIDTKYYTESIQTKAGRNPKQKSGNMYQIFAYVKNKETQLLAMPHVVSGMLLYARTDDAIQPDQKYLMSGNRIDVRTLNLNCDFSEIKAQLNQVVEEFFQFEDGMEKTCFANF